MPGKPAVACLEGPSERIEKFLKITRKELFATVAPSSRKMKLVFQEPNIKPAFKTFEEVQLNCLGGTHKRKDIADLGELSSFLEAAGCGHAFKEIFNDAVVKE